MSVFKTDAQYDTQFIIEGFLPSDMAFVQLHNKISGEASSVGYPVEEVVNICREFVAEYDTGVTKPVSSERDTELRFECLKLAEKPGSNYPGSNSVTRAERFYEYVTTGGVVNADESRIIEKRTTEQFVWDVRFALGLSDHDTRTWGEIERLLKDLAGFAEERGFRIKDKPKEKE